MFTFTKFLSDTLGKREKEVRWRVMERWQARLTGTSSRVNSSVELTPPEELTPKKGVPVPMKLLRYDIVQRFFFILRHTVDSAV